MAHGDRGQPAGRRWPHGDAITTVLKSPAVSQQILNAGGEPVAGTPQELAEQLRQDLARWSRIAKLSGASLD